MPLPQRRSVTGVGTTIKGGTPAAARTPTASPVRTGPVPRAAAPVVRKTTPPPPKPKGNMWEIPFPPDTDFGGGVPTGDYLLRCEKEPWEDTDQDGNPMQIFGFTIQDPEFPDLEGRPAQFRCNRDPRFGWKWTMVLTALGFQEGQDFEVRKTSKQATLQINADPMDFIGRTCRGTFKKAKGSENDPTARAWLNTVRPVGETLEELEGGVIDTGGELAPEDIPFE